MKIVLKAEQITDLYLFTESNTTDDIMRKYYIGELPESLLSIEGYTLMNALTIGCQTVEEKWKEKYETYAGGFTFENSTTQRALIELAQDFGLDIIPKEATE